MKSKLNVAFAARIFAFCLSVGASKAETITFDDIPSGDIVLNGYHGFNWSNFFTEAAGQTVLAGSGFANGVVSSPIVAFIPNQLPAPAPGSGYFSDTSAFTLNSLYLTAAWSDGLNVTIQGLSGGIAGTVLDSYSLLVNTSGPTLVNLDWTGIDTVSFQESGGVHNPNLPNGSGLQLVFDNITVNAPVSVPGPVVGAGFPGLMFAGGGLLSWWRRKRKAAAAVDRVARATDVKRRCLEMARTQVGECSLRVSWPTTWYRATVHRGTGPRASSLAG